MYITAANQSNAEGASMSDSTAPSDSMFAAPGSKEKKDKPKSKTAQQVQGPKIKLTLISKLIFVFVLPFFRLLIGHFIYTMW